MAGLRFLKAFTLIETLVAGILISIVSGTALMIYLNISASLAKTQDIVIREIARTELDSLALIRGEFEKTYDHAQWLTVVGIKTLYETDESVYLVRVALEDSLGNVWAEQKKLIYEPK